jgi:hypothetical protein
MVTLVIGRFELPRINDDEFADLGTRQQVDGRAARATASHGTDDRVPKSLRNMCAEKLRESLLYRFVCCEFASLGRKVKCLTCLLTEQLLTVDQTIIYREPVSSVEYSAAER